MLSKELIRVKRSGKLLKPQFLELDDSWAIEKARRVLQFFQEHQNMERRVIEEHFNTLLFGNRREIIILKSFFKLVKDACKFELNQPNTDQNFDWISFRHSVFAESARLLKEKCPGRSLQEYENEIKGRLNSLNNIKSLLYSDLPECECLKKGVDWSEKDLINRYNVALVQFLLLNSGKTCISVNKNCQDARRLARYLKFFRLLPRISENQKTFDLEVEGPASQLEGMRKYGLQLASFFIVLCTANEWSFEAEIEWKQHQGVLKLTNQSGLYGIYQKNAVFIPEEIRCFEKVFNDKQSLWCLLNENKFLNLNDQLVVPDFIFQRMSDNAVVYMEIFHQWHATGLKERLQRLDEQKPKMKIPLLIAVEQHVAHQKEIQSILSQSAWFSSYGIVFRDFPVISKVVSALDAVANVDLCPVDPEFFLSDNVK